MTSFRVKFRPSCVEGKMGTIFYQVIHQRKVRLFTTTYHIFANEWDDAQGQLRLSPFNPRLNTLRNYNEAIRKELQTFGIIIERYGQMGLPFTADDVVEEFVKYEEGLSVTQFMKSVIVQLQFKGFHRTSETYQASLSKFRRFLGQRRIVFEAFDTELICAYENFLHNQGLSPNTSSFYLRTLRAVYNRAVNEGLATQTHPFRRVYTGVAKTEKRAVPLEVIRQVKTANLDFRPGLKWARDLFMFSFYTRGMSFVDMAYLKKSDLQDGMLVYRRRKTNQELKIRWEACMQTIVDGLHTHSTSPYLLPIICHIGIDERRQYRNAMTLANRKLGVMSKALGLETPLSMYVARHSWASIAKSRNVPLSIISEGMGHDSESTTKIYLTSFDNVRIDSANRVVLEAL